MERKKLETLRGKLLRKDKGLFSEAWNLFWFHLEGDKLCFYKDESCLEHLGFYDLSLKGITVHPTNYGNALPTSGKVKKYEFQLTIPKIPRVQEGVSVFLAATSHELLWYWVDGIIQWTTIFRKAKQKRTLKKELATKQDPQIDQEFNSTLYSGSPRLGHLTKVRNLTPHPVAANQGNLVFKRDRSRSMSKMNEEEEETKITSLEDALEKIKELENEMEGERQCREILQRENESLRKQNTEANETIRMLKQRFFFSIAMAMKLERKLSQTDSKSINVQVMWHEIEEQKIPFHDWPEWLSERLSM